MNICKQQSGFTLIEALIALLVLSIGLLGIAGLQATSLRYNQDSHSRSIATMLANEMMEKIHSNAARLNSPEATAAAYAAGNSGAPCDFSASSVDNDLNCWDQSLQTLLTTGSGVIQDNNDTPRTVTLTISWVDREQGVANPKQQSWIFSP